MYVAVPEKCLIPSQSDSVHEINSGNSTFSGAPQPAGKQTFLITSGECTVTVDGDGKGGRNQEMLLAMIQELKANPELNIRFSIVSMAFDGIEGNSPATGAIIDNQSLSLAKKKKLDVSKLLSDNNSYAFFNEMGDAITIGQTGTNVNDVYCLVIDSN